MIPRQIQITVGILLVVIFAMAFYLLQLKSRAERHARAAAAAAPVAITTGPQTAVQLLIADDNVEALSQTTEEVALPTDASERARVVLRLLLAEYKKNTSHHPLDVGSDVTSVFLLKDGTAVVDLNEALAHDHPQGVMPELLTLDSIAQTLHANDPQIKQARFIVGGKPRDTLAGHADLRLPYSGTAAPEEQPSTQSQ